MASAVNVAADEPEIEADIERLNQIRLQLVPTKIEVFSASSSEDEDSDGDYGQFMNIRENEEDEASPKEEHASGTIGLSSISEFAEDQRHDSDEMDAASEPTLENCLYLNHVYQDLIHESIEDIELLLKLNQENQANLREKMSAKCSKPTSNRSIEKFTTPYFKDSRNMMPPPNEDTKIKTARGELDSNVRYRRPWSESEKKTLVKAVKSNAMEKALQGVTSSKDMLNMELYDEESTLTLEEIADKRKKVLAKEKQIEAVQLSIGKNPIGPIDANYDWMKISTMNFEGKRSANECEIYWKNYLHPSINKAKWGKEEVDKLAELVKQHGHQNWESITQLLQTGRTALQCFEKYQNKISKDRLKGKWTVEEQERLKRLVDAFRIGDYIPWYRVFYFMEGRTNMQVWNHWYSRLNPDIRKGRFTEEEDLLLLSAVWMLGPKNWWRIKSYVPGRTSMQCRERWVYVLDPARQCARWSPEEDEKILQMVRKHGHRWSLIASQMPGRTDTDIKIRCRALMQHVMDDNTLSSHSLRGFEAFGHIQESYRARLFKRLVCAVRAHVKTSGEGRAALAGLTTEALIRSVSDTALAPGPRGRKLPADTELSELMCKMSVGDLKSMFARKTRSKAHPGTKAIDRELEDYFRTATQKKKRGRPFKIVEPPEDAPEYQRWIGEHTALLSGRPAVKTEDGEPEPCGSYEVVPFLPPSATSLQAFRGLLLQKSSMKPLPLSRCPSLPTDGSGSSRTPEDESYETLFARFAAVFFWPALLSVVQPEEEVGDNKPRRLSKREIGRLKHEKHIRKKMMLQAAAEEAADSTVPAETPRPVPAPAPAPAPAAREDETTAGTKRKRRRSRTEVEPTRRSARRLEKPAAESKAQP